MLQLQVLFIGLVLLTPGNAGSCTGAIAGKRRTRYSGSCLYPVDFFFGMYIYVMNNGQS